MSIFLVPASAATLAELRGTPDSIEDFLYPDDGDSEPPGCVDLDKAWHGLHYLLTGRANGGEGAASEAILGGEPLGDDLGMGPARVLEPHEVAAVSAALGALPWEVLKLRFDPQDMERQDIYPSIIWVRDGDENLDYLEDNYRVLVHFYADAAGRGDGAVLCLA